MCGPLFLFLSAHSAFPPPTNDKLLGDIEPAFSVFPPSQSWHMASGPQSWFNNLCPVSSLPGNEVRLGLMGFIPGWGLIATSPLSEAQGATLRLEIWPVLSLTQLLRALFRGEATQVARASHATFPTLWGHKSLLAAPSSPTASFTMLPCLLHFSGLDFLKAAPLLCPSLHPRGHSPGRPCKSHFMNSCSGHDSNPGARETHWCREQPQGLVLPLWNALCDLMPLPSPLWACLLLWPKVL